MINAIFKTDGDGICIAYNRAIGAGEYQIMTLAKQWTRGWNPKFYRDNGGTFEPRSQEDINAVIEAEELAQSERAARTSAIEQARETEGLADITLEQAQAYMESMLDTSGLSLAEFDAATDFTTVKAAIRNLMIDIYNQFQANKEVHLREIPYILK